MSPSLEAKTPPMPHPIPVGKALTNSWFCEELIGGQPTALLAELDLARVEREVVLATKANAIQVSVAQPHG